MNYCLEVIRQKLTQSRIKPLEAVENLALADGEAILRVDRFGLTANNITYGVAGDVIGYWQFFPADSEWGRIPVWGTGTVIDAGSTDLSNGAVYYGYFLMGSYLVVKPGQVTARGFVDDANHRASTISINWLPKIMVSLMTRLIIGWFSFHCLLQDSCWMII